MGIEFKVHGWSSGKTLKTERPLDDILISVCKAKPPNRYLEIGTREGGSISAVLTHSEPPPKKVVMCDPWTTEHGGTGRGSHHHIEEVLEGLKFGGVARFLDGRSQQLSPTLKETFDLILIDGDHTPCIVAIDVRNCWPLLDPGGILVMDDTFAFGLTKLVDPYEGAKLIHVDKRRNGVHVYEKVK